MKPVATDLRSVHTTHGGNTGDRPVWRFCCFTGWLHILKETPVCKLLVLVSTQILFTPTNYLSFSLVGSWTLSYSASNADNYLHCWIISKVIPWLQWVMGNTWCFSVTCCFSVKTHPKVLEDFVLFVLKTLSICYLLFCSAFWSLCLMYESVPCYVFCITKLYKK